ncbi:hypothetical protein C0Q70_01326 [Pomacea canaliculata]|uniref:Uncharacterized protein n=1 Tax=Pomacea canaliculata TaxID=400727 RepID=A0A2T7PZ48_POMCA|nr:hypothetical protein C0Q70_01326 [Pomacea canaliculata]
MNEDESQSDEAQYEHWMGKFEAECFQQLESEDNMEERLESERELAVQQLWITFQNSATAIAQLYKGRIFGQAIHFNNLCIPVLQRSLK